MNEDLKRAFSMVKPLCDSIMTTPTMESINHLENMLKMFNHDTIQELQLYILFPILTHISSLDMKNTILHCQLIDTMCLVLNNSSITSTELFRKYHTALINLLFDKNQPHKISDRPEELKNTLVNGLVTIMVRSLPYVRVKLFKMCKPMLAQTIFIAVQIAKEEKFRTLRISAINCIRAFSGIHRDCYGPSDENGGPGMPAVELLSSVLPGLAGALLEVTQGDNPGYLVIQNAVNCLKNIIVLSMNDCYLDVKTELTDEDFSRLYYDKIKISKIKMTNKDNISLKLIPRESPEWFTMAGEKLKVITKNLTPLQMHDHYLVRLELGKFCSEILTHCLRTMQPSVPIILEILISLSKDKHEEVATLCGTKLQYYFKNIPPENRYKVMDTMTDSFIAAITNLPNVLNNIHDNLKLSTLLLVRGYLVLLCDSSRPQRLTQLLSLQHTLIGLCHSLLQAANMDGHITVLALTAVQYMDTPLSSQNSTWCRLKNLNKYCEDILVDICHILGKAECADLIVDQLLDLFANSSTDRKEAIYLLNHICVGSSNPSLMKRVLDTYIEPDTWYLPLEVTTSDVPLTSADTLDIDVYNPRAWDKDYVPGLYEGAIETRYTDISYQVPRPVSTIDSSHCSNLSMAIDNMITSCLLTAGMGQIARELAQQFQAYLLKTLCLVLERVGSRYEMLHLSGVCAINDIAFACGYSNVSELIRHNADYFTYQITTRLKKVWNSQSALEILSVVMRNTDSTIFNCLYGIVSDVLVHSCDKYHKNDLSSYLQVFQTFLNCIDQWFPNPRTVEEPKAQENSFVNDLNKIIDDFDRMSHLYKDVDEGKSAEEMYEEDQKKKEDEVLDYDDHVTEEKAPPPQQITITVTIVKRCINFVPSKRRSEQLLALQILDAGLKILRNYENELLPIVHLIWSPLVLRFDENTEPIVQRQAFKLLVTMGEVSKDFVGNRIAKEVLPKMYDFLRKSSQNSHLKDVGSSYRSSQAYKLQLSMLAALSTLIVDIDLGDTQLEAAMLCAQLYLSNKQPKELQELAVKFFTTSLNHDYGATYLHLRKLCNNNILMTPKVDSPKLEPIMGSPFSCTDKTYDSNIQKLFICD